MIHMRKHQLAVFQNFGLEWLMDILLILII